MQLTPEQHAIVNSSGDIKINAVAGSGKTTTVIEYARTRPAPSRILYLAFNKTVKQEAERKFLSKGLNNVKVETAHSLAYKNIVFKHKYTVSSNGYKTQEIAQILGLKGSGEKHTEFIIANHINKFITYFCNSDKKKVQDLDYRNVVTDPKAKAFVNLYYDYLERQTREFLSKMDKGEINITHDFYLKKFQLSNPQLNYNYILFDEGQDASPAMLDIFLKQKATKVIVGDTHQQIYSWRYAVNSLEKVSFKDYYLSKSFRFGQDIAKLATSVLKWKEHIQKNISLNIDGEGKAKENKSKAVLGRTNLGLLLKAINITTENRGIKHIYFEGNFNTYTYADDGASLYDVLNLYNGKIYLIRDPLIKAMNGMNELEDYINHTEDAQLSMMVEIVKEYENEIPSIINSIKEKHVGDDQKEKAQYIFSTVHRCKGMEYDNVELVNDFISEEKLEKQLKDLEENDPAKNKLNEEINLLYVAITRTKKYLSIPFELMPKNFPSSSDISIIDDIVEDIEDKAKTKQKSSYSKTKSKMPVKSLEQLTGKKQQWTEKQDKRLTSMYLEGIRIGEIADELEKTKGEIYSRIKKLELWEKYGY